MKQIEVSDEELHLILDFRHKKLCQEAYEAGVADAAKLIINRNGRSNEELSTLLFRQNPQALFKENEVLSCNYQSGRNDAAVFIRKWPPTYSDSKLLGIIIPLPQYAFNDNNTLGSQKS